MSFRLPEDLALERTKALAIASLNGGRTKTASYGSIDYEFLHSVAFRLQRQVILALKQEKSFSLLDPVGLSAETASYASDAFNIYRVLPLPHNEFLSGIHLVKMACLGVMGPSHLEHSLWLKQHRSKGRWHSLLLSSDSIISLHLSTTTDVWLRLLGAPSKKDYDAIITRVVGLETLRADQDPFSDEKQTSLSPCQKTDAIYERLASSLRARSSDENSLQNIANVLFRLVLAGKSLVSLLVSSKNSDHDQLLSELQDYFAQALHTSQQAELTVLEELTLLLRSSAKVSIRQNEELIKKEKIKKKK